VIVEVCKFFLGYWRSHDFSVRPGDVIGRVVEADLLLGERTRLQSQDPMTLYGTPVPGLGDPAFQPVEIDFSTGATLVGLRRVDGWTGGTRLRPRVYHEMFYGMDGASIQRTPIGPQDWTAEQSDAYAAIKEKQREPVEPHKPWAQTAWMDSGYGY
jgi:hypothetical protein